MYHSAQIHEARVYSLAEHGEGYQLAHGLTLGEMACKDGSDIVVVSPRIVQGYDVFRRAWGRPIIVDSGFRTWLWHVSIYEGLGVAAEEIPKFSRHLYGGAIDCKEHDPVAIHEMYALVEEIGFGGIGKYSWGIHIDDGDPNRRW